MQRTLATPRLVLRPATADDLDALHTLWTHPEVRRFLWDDQLISRDAAAATLSDCLHLAADGLGLWVCELPGAAGPQAVGCAGLLPVSTATEYDAELAGMVEPLVALDPARWGRGYAHEALGALLDYATAALRLRRLAGVTDVPNHASDRMLRRAGFQARGEVRGPRHPLRLYVWHSPE
jgi:RimJ/RimL family protein N-acetyltransferase